LTAPQGAANYLWNTGETTQAIEVFAGGNYTCTLTPFQGGGCEIVLYIDIIENPTPVANFSSSTLTACLNDIIDFTDLSTIPNPGIITNYRWNFGDGTITPISNGPIVAVPNTTGTYIAPSHTFTSSGVLNVELYVESADGCSDLIVIPVTINALPIVVAGVDQIVCDGAAVTLPGAGASIYNWDNGVTNGVPFVQPVGTITYTVIGTDANGCQNTDQVDITLNPLPNVNAGLDQTLCVGPMITLNASGANGYVWDNGVINGVPFAQGAGTVTYNVMGTDLNGCQNTDQVDVIVNPLPIVNAGIDQTLCDGPLVTLSGSGANSYAWDNSVINGVPFAQGVGTINYTVIGTDVNGCQNTDQVDVVVNPNPTIDAGVDQSICEDSWITRTASGAPNLVLDNGIMNNVPFQQGVGTINYTVIGTLATGCFTSDIVSVTVLQNPIVSAEDVVICEGEAVILEGAGAVSYQWSGGIIDGQAFYPNQNGSFTVTGTAANGCTSQAQVNVTVHAAPIVDFDVLNLHLTTTDPTTGFDNLSIGAVSYEWNFSDGSPINTQFEPTHSFPEDHAGEYYIELTGYSEFGCSSRAIKYVHVFRDYIINVPNAFTPNNSGLNEVFKPVMTGFDEQGYTMYIFNRWGNLIFETHDMQVGWDGTFHNDNTQVQDGVFTWKIEAKIKDSADSKVFVGHVSLLK
jgi:trimeric autotransporter adhesin